MRAPRLFAALLLTLPAPLPAQVAAVDCPALIATASPLSAADARTLALECGAVGRERLLSRYRADLGATRGPESAMVGALATVRSRSVLDAVHAVLDEARMPTVASIGAILLLHRYWGEVVIDPARLDHLATMPRPHCIIMRTTVPFAVDEGIADSGAITRSVERIYKLAMRGPPQGPLANAPLCMVLNGTLWAPSSGNLSAADDSAVVRLAERAILDRLAESPRDPGSWWWRITVPDSTAARDAWRGMVRRLRTLVQARDSVAGDSVASVIHVDAGRRLGDVLLFSVDIGVRYRCGTAWRGDTRDSYLAALRGADGWPERAREVGGAWSESFGCR